LGGSRKNKYRTLINIFLVFVISGLWHGAAYNFLIWGSIHGFYQIYENSTQNLRSKVWNKIGLDKTPTQSFIKWFITMFVVLISWVFFRAQSLSDSLYIISKISNDFLSLEIFNNIPQMFGRTNIGIIRLGVVIFAIIILELSQVFEEKLGFDVLNLPRKFYKIQWIVYYIIIFVVILFGYFGQSEFIYFQF